MDAGRPHNTLAPKKAVAALLLPPPMPAWAGMRFCRPMRKKRPMPLRSRKSFSARMTRLDSSTGTPGRLHSSSSRVASGGRTSSSSVSPKAVVWKSEAKSW